MDFIPRGFPWWGFFHYMASPIRTPVRVFEHGREEFAVLASFRTCYQQTAQIKKTEHFGEKVAFCFTFFKFYRSIFIISKQFCFLSQKKKDKKRVSSKSQHQMKFEFFFEFLSPSELKTLTHMKKNFPLGENDHKMASVRLKNLKRVRRLF